MSACRVGHPSYSTRFRRLRPSRAARSPDGVASLRQRRGDGRSASAAFPSIGVAMVRATGFHLDLEASAGPRLEAG